MRTRTCLAKIGLILLAGLLAGTARAADRNGGPLNKARFPDERKVLLSRVHQRAFPRLENRFEVLASSTKVYNCIAHSLGDHEHWIDPRLGTRDHPLTEMDRIYRKRGYSRLPDMDFSLEPGMRKLVLYARVGKNGGIEAITHSAVQAADGSWQSKLGELALIRHLTPSALTGPNYGQPVAVYARSRK